MKSVRALLVSLILAAFTQLHAGEVATAIAAVTAGFISGITVISAGSGYSSEPTVTISGGGGTGATAKATLVGDRVSSIILQSAGSGYSSAPLVSISEPPNPLGLDIELVPKLTLRGAAGSHARVEWAATVSGPWTVWTNVIVNLAGVVLVDLTSGVNERFYRAVADFVWISPGTFRMGSPVSELERDPDEVQHTVTITKGFWISDHEVTQVEYQAVMGNNPSTFRGSLLPVETISWNDAVEYCRKLTEQERSAGRISTDQSYRLPTEAEWEYAARAGSTEARYGEVGTIAWWSGNSGSRVRAVRGKLANAWGLYDMLGNLWEFCADWYGNYPTGSVVDPIGPTSGSLRVSRGGAWNYPSWNDRFADRTGYDPTLRSYSLGFRPVLSSVR